MGQTVDMDLNAARAWKDSIDSLNSQLKGELVSVGDSINAISQSSQGGVLDHLVNNYQQMTEATGNLVNAFAGLVDSVANVIEKATGLAGKVIDILGIIKL